MRNVFTVYQTNKRNILGGYMTYNNIDDAFNNLDIARGCNTITAVTMVNAEWWHGEKKGHLYEILSSGVIYRA